MLELSYPTVEVVTTDVAVRLAAVKAHTTNLRCFNTRELTGKVKAVGSAYAAGRRGSNWIKVKPVLTYDLVVLACEWGSGRRTGLLSNLHLGALDPTGEFGEPGGYVMVGKTFKGLTDALLRWQTGKFQEREVRRTAGTVWVEPVTVVEIAIDGVQRSSRAFIACADSPAGVPWRLTAHAQRAAGQQDGRLVSGRRPNDS